MKIFDISKTLKEGMPVWPGDPTFQYRLISSIENGDGTNVGELTLGTHTGTHIDAPFHFDEKGKKVDELDLNVLIGNARVVEFTGKTSIGIDDFQSIDLNGIRRVLLKTNSWKDRNIFPNKITFLKPELGAFFAEAGVQLVGVDVPSVDPINSTTLDAHHELGKHGIYILESVNLTEVEPGEYELIALPLKVAGGDGCPVRAVLISR